MAYGLLNPVRAPLDPEEELRRRLLAQMGEGINPGPGRGEPEITPGQDVLPSSQASAQPMLPPPANANPPQLLGQPSFGVRGPAGPPVVPPMPALLKPYRPSIFERIRQGIATGAGRLVGLPDESTGLLSDDERSYAKRQGLLRFASAIAGAPGESSTAGAIARAIPEGQAGAAQGVATREAYSERIRQAGFRARRQAISQKYAGANTGDPQVLRQMVQEFAQLALAGDNESSNIVGSLSNILNSTQDQGFDLAFGEMRFDAKGNLIAQNTNVRPQANDRFVSIVQSGAEKGKPHWFRELPDGSSVDTGLEAPATNARRPVMQERLAGNAAGRAIPAQRTLIALEKADPTVPGRLYEKLARFKGILPKLRQKFYGDEALEAELYKDLKPDEKTYFTNARQYMAGLLRTEIGLQQTLSEFERQKGAWFPPAVGGERDIGDYQRRRYDDIRAQIHASGGDFEDYWLPILQSRGEPLDLYGYPNEGGVGAPSGGAGAAGTSTTAPGEYDPRDPNSKPPNYPGSEKYPG